MLSRRELANAIRALSMDAVQQANSGHPGMPMGMADIAEVLWNDFLQHNPAHPDWPNRDRFILSNGHGSMLIYSLLHLTGYDVSIEDIKQFRQFGSKTPGHPEYHDTPGIETTTGPLGQGLANAVGMVLAEKVLAAQFNRPDHNIVDHYTYVFAGDGCLMEGVSHEASSLAGTLGLGKLIVFWDDNEISIDGKVEGWFTDHTPQRFESYGWHVVANVDGHDADAVRRAINMARDVTDQPSLICCRTVIGYGSPSMAGTNKVHGAPLGKEEVAAAREKLAWPYAPFEIPQDYYDAWDAKEKGQQRENAWQEAMQAYTQAYPELAEEFTRRLKGELPASWQSDMTAFIKETNSAGANIATRKASQNCLETFKGLLPELLGGSADLSGSNLTLASTSRIISHQNANGNYIYYGVREFAMSAIMNGIALHKGFIPYGGTFLVFSDYARNALRMAALMQQRVVFVYTHDSIGLGEDGPTHQPIEHLASLRLIPNMTTWRPCDAVETAVAWRAAIEASGPTCLALSRQGLPHQTRTSETIANIARGGYILRDAEGAPNTLPQVIIMATGSEVALAMNAADALTKQGVGVRVVSMPSVDIFAAQAESYREQVLPKAVKARLAIEAGSTMCWLHYVGDEGAVIGLDHFGASAPAEKLFEVYGFTVDNVITHVKSLLS